MHSWNPIQKPAGIAEERLLQAILSGHFAVNSLLPGERDLAARIGVTRPTLREAMQRLARDGWIEIQQGKSTRVRDYWHEGSLGVLVGLARMPSPMMHDFVTYLLEVRVLLAPAYTYQALETASREIAEFLETTMEIEDSPATFARADWDLHFLLTQRASNPIFRMLLNSFRELYREMGELYFALNANRERSKAYYTSLLICAKKSAPVRGERLTREVMEESLKQWREVKA